MINYKNRVISILLSLILMTLTASFAFAFEKKDAIKINTKNFDQISLNFKALDPSNVLISDSVLLEKVAEFYRNKTKYKLKNIKTNLGHSEISGFGVDLNINNSEMIFHYSNYTDLGSGRERGNKLFIYVPYIIKRDSDVVNLLLKPSNDAVLNYTNGIFGKSEFYDLPSIDVLSKDIQNILFSSEPVKLKFFSTIKDEAVTGFKPDSSLTNFERILGRYTSSYSGDLKYDLKRENLFSYRFGRDLVPLKITIFPYREGAKAIYEVAGPYYILSDGSQENFNAFGKLKIDVNKILND